MARASSGSRSCSSSVEPLISANSAVTVFRSPSLADGSCCSATGAGSRAAGFAVLAFASSGAPQSRQNFAGGEYSAPHFGHLAGKEFPHSEQNLVPGGFSELQFEQRIYRFRPLRLDDLAAMIPVHPVAPGEYLGKRWIFADLVEINHPHWR